MPRRAGLAVLELHEHTHLHLLPDAADAGAVVVVVALQDQLLRHWHAARAEQRHLLGLLVGDGRGSLQRVEVVLEELLLRHRAWRHRGLGAHRAVLRREAHLVAHAVDVARDELQAGVGVGGAAGIGERHPAVEVERAVGGVQLGDVVGLPGEPPGQVGKLDRLRAGAAAGKLGDQRRLVAQVGRHAVEDDAAREPRLDAIADLQHHAAVGGEHGRLLDRFGAGSGVRAHDAHVAPHVLLEELGGREQVEVEVLLEQRERTGVGKAAQLRRLRTHASAHLAQGDPVRPHVQRDAPGVLHQCQVLVVDGDGDRLLVRERARPSRPPRRARWKARTGRRRGRPAGA